MELLVCQTLTPKHPERLNPGFPVPAPLFKGTMLWKSGLVPRMEPSTHDAGV